jgi:hypothetical protein
MDIDLSSTEMKAASTGFTVATEIAKERLREGDQSETGRTHVRGVMRHWPSSWRRHG